MELSESMELGVQPLEEVMIRMGLKNDDLVKASVEMLTHKMVKKGRHGRRLTLNVKQKILNALNTAKPDGHFAMKDIFNY